MLHSKFKQTKTRNIKNIIVKLNEIQNHAFVSGSGSAFVPSVVVGGSEPFRLSLPVLHSTRKNDVELMMQVRRSVVIWRKTPM